MGHLVLYQLGGRRSNVYGLSVYHNRSSLYSENIKLKGSHMGLIPMKKVSIGIHFEAGMGHMSKSITV
jgi:hypothetical protein